jgi:hypothetical protein
MPQNLKLALDFSQPRPSSTVVPQFGRSTCPGQFVAPAQMGDVANVAAGPALMRARLERQRPSPGLREAELLGRREGLQRLPHPLAG